MVPLECAFALVEDSDLAVVRLGEGEGRAAAVEASCAAVGDDGGGEADVVVVGLAVLRAVVDFGEREGGGGVGEACEYDVGPAVAAQIEGDRAVGSHRLKH